MRAAGRSRSVDESWVAALVHVRWAYRKDRAERALTVKAARALGTSKEDAAAFDSIYRLQGRTAANRWVLELLNPPPPPMPRAQALAMARHALGRKAADRERHCRRMLARWERAQARAEAAVARWAAKVRYYDLKTQRRGSTES